MKSFSFLVFTAIIFGAVFTSCDKNDVNLNEFTVFFNCNDGSDVPTQNIKEGEQVTKPVNPTRNGYVFVAWFKEMELANEWKFDIDIVTSDITLYAKWIEEPEEAEPLIFKFQRLGGWIALNENLIIKSDSTHFSITSISPKISFQTTIKTSDILWRDLKRTFDLSTFNKITDGPCWSCVDGIDYLFFVTIETETYKIYNGNYDEYFKQMQDFFDLIFEQAEYFEKIAGFSK
jgi:uncharacterized repeat protein (TIGR02543 family)